MLRSRSLNNAALQRENPDGPDGPAGTEIPERRNKGGTISSRYYGSFIHEAAWGRSSAACCDTTLIKTRRAACAAGGFMIIERENINV